MRQKAPSLGGISLLVHAHLYETAWVHFTGQGRPNIVREGGKGRRKQIAAHFGTKERRFIPSSLFVLHIADATMGATCVRLSGGRQEEAKKKGKFAFRPIITPHCV